MEGEQTNWNKAYKWVFGVMVLTIFVFWLIQLKYNHG